MAHVHTEPGSPREVRAGAPARHLAHCRLRERARQRAPPAAAPAEAKGLSARDNEEVIHDADRSLAAWLGAMLPPGTPVSFDAPDPASLRRPLVSCFLYDIAEDTGGMAGQERLLRDADGHAVAWQRATRRYRLSYLMTAWSADAAAEHELLGAVLAGSAAAGPVLPADCLRGALVDAGLPAEIRCAPPGSAADAGGMGAAGLCQALGMPPRAAMTLVLVAPVRPAAQAGLAPPARAIDLGASALDPSGEPAAAPSAAASASANAVRPQARRWERAKITEGRG